MARKSFGDRWRRPRDRALEPWNRVADTQRSLDADPIVPEVRALQIYPMRCLRRHPS